MEEKIRKFLVAIKMKDFPKVSPEMHLNFDLGLSSFELRQIVYMVEEEFSIDIPHDEINKLQTVRDLMDCISGQKP
jgi:acyl carrier protein